MHTDEKMPAGDGNPAAGHTDAPIVPSMATPLVLTDKEFTTLQAAFALCGYAVHRQDAAKGATGIYAMRCGLVWDLPTADDATRFLSQIGGNL